MSSEKRAEPDWQDIRAFLALGRRGSLSAAARMLGVNHTTIARRIKALENALGQKLSERRPDGYERTAAGMRIIAAASEMETAAETMVRGGVADVPKGLV